MSLTVYHQKPEAKGHHDLIENAQPPRNLGKLLSLSRKFITQRPRAPIHHYKDFLDRFSPDVRTKYVFRDADSQPPRLHYRNEQLIPPTASEPVEQAIRNLQSE